MNSFVGCFEAAMQRIVYVVLLFAFASSLVGCSSIPTPASPSMTTPTASSEQAQTGAFHTGEYRNLFHEYLGKSDAEIQAKIDAAWEQLFYGDDASERVYYPVGEDMAYIADIGNGDVRSEGMSYAQ